MLPRCGKDEGRSWKDRPCPNATLALSVSQSPLPTMDARCSLSAAVYFALSALRCVASLPQLSTFHNIYNALKPVLLRDGLTFIVQGNYENL